MKRLGFWLLMAVMLGTACPAMAQLRIGVKLDRHRYMLLEPIDVLVGVENNTEMEVLLHGAPQRPWLKFIVTRDGIPVRRDLGRDFSEVLIQPGQTRTLKVNITPLYSIREPGEYTVRGVLSIPGHPDVISAPVNFEVRPGESLWSETRPVDGSMRTYQLLKFNPTISSTRLYLQVTDRQLNRVYNTTSLGASTAILPPQAYWDKNNELHVLFTVGLGHYRYCAFDQRGNLRARKSYESTPTYPPRLFRHTDGLVMVVGGRLITRDARPKMSEATFGEERLLDENTSPIQGQARAPGAEEPSDMPQGPTDADLPPDQRAAQTSAESDQARTAALKAAEAQAREMQQRQLNRPKSTSSVTWGLPDQLEDEALPER